MEERGITLLEFIDEHLMSSPISVYSVDGRKVADIPEGDESAIASVRDYANGRVEKEVRTESGWTVYVKPKPLPPERGPVVMGYPGEVEDEAKFSLDWRSREPKASDKQVAFLSRNYRLYLAVRKETWPRDVSLLLRYEASDAMTEILKIVRKAEASDRERPDPAEGDPC